MSYVEEAVSEGSIDNFKAKERQIRNYFRSLRARKDKQKRSNPVSNSSTSSLFDASQLVDMRAPEWRARMTCSSSSSAISASQDVLSLPGILPEGLYLLPNALSRNAQMRWARTALEQYSLAEHNNLTNLDRISAAESVTNSTHTLDMNARTEQPNLVSAPKVGDAATITTFTNSDCNTTTTTDSNNTTTVSNSNTNTITAADTNTKTNTTDKSLWFRSIEENDDFRSFFRLRWSSLGYHYSWTERMYVRNDRSPFPHELKELCRSVAKCASADLDFEPEAAIVNYYPSSSNMGGHLDDAEHAMDQPIVSLSLGCSAIFLIGGRTKEEEPVAVLLRSGDALVMSGESRLCYHGVPAILSDSFEPAETGETRENEQKQDHELEQELEHEQEHSWRRHVRQYLQMGRININVRQVQTGEGEGGWEMPRQGTGAKKKA